MSVSDVDAVEPPIDLHYCCRKLKSGVGWMYDGFLARTLWRDFSQRSHRIPGSDQLRIPRRPRTLLEFDTHITSYLAGFESPEDYYEIASSKDVLSQIRVPVAVLTATDDPIVPVEVFDGAAWSPTTRLFIAEGGGHLGFIGNSREFDEAGTNRWMDACLLHWIQSIPSFPGSTKPQLAPAEIS